MGLEAVCVPQRFCFPVHPCNTNNREQTNKQNRRQQLAHVCMSYHGLKDSKRTWNFHTRNAMKAP